MADKSIRIRVGREIKELRKKKGWSQKELAQVIGKTTPTVSKIELGQQGLDVVMFMQIVEELGGIPALVLLKALHGGKIKVKDPEALVSICKFTTALTEIANINLKKDKSHTPGK